MNRLITVLLLMVSVPVFAQPHGCPIGTQLEGRYLASKGKGYLPNTLKISPTNDGDAFQFDLQAFWSPKPNNDGSATTQGVFTGEIQVRWCVGHYVSEDRACFLVFNMAQNKIKVTSFGECSYGHNAYPDATYVKQHGK